MQQFIFFGTRIIREESLGINCDIFTPISHGIYGMRVFQVAKKEYQYHRKEVCTLQCVWPGVAC